MSRSDAIVNTEEGYTIIQDRLLVNGSIDLDTPLLNPHDEIPKEKE